MTEIQVTGAEHFVALTHRIKEHADAKALQKELYSGLNRVTKPVRKSMQEAAGRSLPKRGGLAALTAKKGTLSAARSTSLKGAGIRIKTKSKGPNLPLYNAGSVRHPVFARKGVKAPWVTQSAGVDAGYLDKAFEEKSDEVRREVIRIIDEVSRKVQ